MTPKANPLRAVLRILFLFTGLFFANTGYAACNTPAGAAGDMTYSTSANVMVYCDGSNWISMAGGVSLTVNTSGGGTATPAGGTNDIQFNNGGALAADPGNFTYATSGGLLTVTNISSTALSASGQGTFGSLLVNGGMTVTGVSSLTTVSASTISTTYIQLPSATTVLACTNGAAGTMRYTSGTMQVCDGSGWTNVGIGVPTGTISAFAATSCPNGWSEYTAARGRFLRGIDNGAGIDPSGSRAPGNQQSDAFQNITGAFKVAGGSGGIDAMSGVFAQSGGNTTYPSMSGGPSAGVGLASFDASRVARTSTETRPTNVAVIFCQYQGYQSQLQTGVATLASLSDVSVAGATSGSVLTYNGSSWIAGTGGSANAAGSANDVQFKNASGGLSADTGSFTYTSATGVLKAPSLLTGGMTATGQASLTTVSTTLLQLTSNTATACSAATAGAQRYNDVSNTIDYCSGSAWLSLGPSATSPVSFMVTKGGTDQTVTANTETKITFNTKSFDTNNNFDTSTSRYTPTIAGKYLFQAGVHCLSMSTGYCGVYILKNGVRAAATQSANNSGDNVQQAGAILSMNGSTDYVEVDGYTNGTKFGGNVALTFLSGVLLSPQGSSSGGTATPAGSTNDIQFNSGGLLAADSGDFTYTSATGTLSATTISTTVVNIASVSTITNVVGGSGNMIASGSAVVSTSSAGTVGLFTGGAQRIFVDGNGVVSVTNDNPIYYYRANNAPHLLLTRALTSLASPAAVTAGTGLGRISFQGYDGTIYSNDANGISMFANENYTSTAHSTYLVLSTTPPSQTVAQERMRIDSNGNVGIGTIATLPNPGVMINPSGWINLGNSAGASGFGFIGFARSGVAIGNIAQNGTTAVAYNTTSDRRVKENITDTREGLQKLMQIRVKDFSFKADPSHTIVNGFIAQDLNKIYPEAVTTNGDNGETALKNKAKVWSVDYGRVTPLIVKAVQDLNIKTDDAVKALTAENDNLRAGLKAANDNIAELRREVDALRRAR